MRIEPLHIATKRINNETPFNHVIKEFLDGLKLSDNPQSLIKVKPDYLDIEDRFCSSEAYNALLAGLVDELCVRFNIERPYWVTLPEYKLDTPFFYCPNTPQRRAMVMANTPGAYRSRNLFCGPVLDSFNI
jgi:hypothetical protein